MSTGQAPSLMLDLAATQAQERLRGARERDQQGIARRGRAARPAEEVHHSRRGWAAGGLSPHTAPAGGPPEARVRAPDIV